MYLNQLDQSFEYLLILQTLTIVSSKAYLKHKRRNCFQNEPLIIISKDNFFKFVPYMLLVKFYLVKYQKLLIQNFDYK